MTTSKLSRKQAEFINDVNGIIHSRNLYVLDGVNHERVVWCRLMDGQITVQGLYTHKLYPIGQYQFTDGNAKLVDFKA